MMLAQFWYRQYYRLYNANPSTWLDLHASFLPLVLHLARPVETRTISPFSFVTMLRFYSDLRPCLATDLHEEHYTSPEEIRVKDKSIA